MQTKLNVIEELKRRRLLFDGGTGTVLAARYGFTEPPELANLLIPDAVEELHYSYLISGADIIKTNTFGASSLKHPGQFKEMIRAAVGAARRAVDRAGHGFVAFDVGPLGRLLKPLGDLDFEEAVTVFRESIAEGAALGCDLVLIETFSEMAETKAAVLAAKEACSLPIFVTNVYGGDGKTLTGSSPLEMITLLEGLSVDAVGMNCSLGPREMLKLLPEFIKYSSLPVIVNPNAGLPTLKDGKAVYTTTPTEFAEVMGRIAESGGYILGGCCGTTPEYIRLMGERVRNIPVSYPEKKTATRICSYCRTLEIGRSPVLIGERINPTGKRRIKEALLSGDYGYISEQASAQEEEGAHALDVNAGLPGIDEGRALRELTLLVSSVTSLPLQLDSSDPSALEGAMRIYCGIPLVNSVSGSEESLRGVLPLVKKYGGVLIALTMDEGGIPKDTRGRVEIAKKILKRAAEYGIGRERIVFDPLTLTAASGRDNATVTLDTVGALHEMGLMTSLGVSNVSFGLPERDTVNSAFLTAALFRGLDAAIMNPHSAAMMNAYRAYLALSGLDEGCLEYVARVIPTSAKPTPKEGVAAQATDCDGLFGAVLRGLTDRARAESRLLLEGGREPMDILNSILIPALDRVGEDYASGRTYLPGLLRSAESASAAFAVLKEGMPRAVSEGAPRFVLATVKGDIHDIGKNIVRLVAESYGFAVIDLGKDVEPERVLRAAVEHKPVAVGLSALMTTTLPGMEATVSLLKQKLPDLPVIVGGAVLTGDYARLIGADHYSPDASEAVAYLMKLIKT